MLAGDLFDPLPGSPVKRPATVAIESQQQHYEAQQMVSAICHVLITSINVQFFNAPNGISPARAMGPPPIQPIRFSPSHPEMMITPYAQKTGFDQAAPSPATSSSSSSLSSIHDAQPLDVSDDDNDDSPTKGPSASRAMSKMQLNDKAGPSRSRSSQPVLTRPQRPTALKPTISGGRTSSKFAKVAEDPGVEGIPPGPRSMERPGPSFACIIGQAILRCSAGGLSLEHIYRYVETAYPFFKNDNPAWRNSVRHNLSIHKMFETIPRTEAFPPGKGGIWIIHEDEKCHWPEENKFIKNFPSSHPHYGVCRQTLHDRAKEKAQIEKAAKEGRVYVPKKGKKARKLPGEEGGMGMMRTASECGEQLFHPMSEQLHHMSMPDCEDEGEYLPVEEEMMVEQVIDTPIVQAPPASRIGMIIPPKFERRDKRRPIEDEENVFTTSKRVRVTEPMPLAPIQAPSQQVVLLDDTFITPERERPPNAKLMSSAFKTPALVNTSSSPGSSPMPPTVTRITHHPSSLAQAWTHDDMTGVADSSPQRPMLDAAFDFQPKATKIRTRTLAGEDDFPISSANPPKTPLTRSSAAREIAKTPGGIMSKTPISFGRSPTQAPGTISAMLSTPMWEMGGCLDRLKERSSPIRSPVPPTSPTRYAILLGSSASPSSKRMRDFSL